MKNGLTICVAFTVAACGADTSGSPSAQVAEAYVLEDTAIVSIGGHDEREEYQLQYAVGAVQLSDGRIVVADAGSRNLRYYDARGQHLHTAGRSGEGPGEFSNLRWMARMRGDSVVAWDVRQRKASVFDPQGNFVDASGLVGLTPPVRADGTPALSIVPIQATRRGDIIVETWPMYNPTQFDDAHVTHDTLPVFGFDRAEQRAQVLGAFPASQYFFYRRNGGLLRFGDRLLVAPATDFAWVGSSRDGVLYAITPSGDTLRSVAAPFERRPVRAEDVPPPEDSWDSGLPVPDSMPLLWAARVSTDDRLWLQQYRAPLDTQQQWAAVGDDGDVLTTLAMDVDMEVLDIGRDFVIVLVRDEFDVQEVQVRRFRSVR